MSDDLRPWEVCVCGETIYWDPAYGGDWAHVFGLEKPAHKPIPAPEPGGRTKGRNARN